MKVSLETPELRATQRQPKTSSQQTSFFSQPFGRVGYRSQRIGRLIFLSSGLLLLIATRLFEIQVIDREQHLSEIYRHKDKTMIEGATGNILDRERGLLAVTDSLPTIGANPGLVDRPRKTASLLAPILGMSIDSLYDRLTNQQQTYINLKREVTNEVADQVRWLDEVGIEIREEKARFYPNGDEYVGEFKDELFCGFGSFFYKDGGVYTGDYKNNLFHGTGTISYADGDKYVGEWANGTYHGKGTYTFSNGKIQKGKFVKGKFTGQ